ncbi:MAG TPA: glycosyltransferase family 2 protein, partial [Pyrinomonadaceae bacterium]
MSNPTVSVILPVYNGENFLRASVESVLGQTLKDYELIVVDDGSQDSTPSIAAEYGERLRYVRQENTGVAGAFNHGLRLARGRYISWLSHDDVFLPAKLERQVAAVRREAGDSPA